ncbi:sre G protein-coupled chemoreceptor domain-containing protein [Ditylenchus destructor]|nr:sre G protein-coupled chemoreceptor domain-containing protein [Ditylenchus destructor]
MQFWIPNWSVSVAEMSKIFSLNARSWAGHFMILERILATFYVRTYEQFKRPHFGALAIVITIVLSLIVTYEEQIKEDKTEIAQLTALVSYIFTILSLVSVVILVMLLWYNQKTYRRNIVHSHSHSLTERYQLSENIRTSRQLIPVIFLHFLSNLIGAAGTLTLFYSYRSLGKWYAIAGNSLVLIVISFNLIIQISVIR